MAKLYICDNDGAHLSLMNQQISPLLVDQKIRLDAAISTSNPYELINCIDASSKNIYVLDIVLNAAMDGLKLGEEIRRRDKEGIIIYVTSYCEYRDLTFKYKLEVYDYLLKSLLFQDSSLLPKTIYSALQRLYQDKAARSDHFIIHDARDKEIPFDELYVIQVSDKPHQLTLLCETGCYYLHESIHQVMKRVNESFVRCHRGHVVNVSKITEIDKRNQIVYLSNGLSVPISKKGLKSLLERI